MVFVKCNIDSCVLSEDGESKVGKLVKQYLLFKQGIEIDMVKKIVKMIKDVKMKVQVSIQGDKVCVIGKKCDDLQVVMVMLCEFDLDIFLQFNNFCD